MRRLVKHFLPALLEERQHQQVLNQVEEHRRDIVPQAVLMHQDLHYHLHSVVEAVSYQEVAEQEAQEMPEIQVVEVVHRELMR